MYPRTSLLTAALLQKLYTTIQSCLLHKIISQIFKYVHVTKMNNVNTLLFKNMLLFNKNFNTIKTWFDPN